jgi:hypothetical protein
MGESAVCLDVAYQRHKAKSGKQKAWREKALIGVQDCSSELPKVEGFRRLRVLRTTVETSYEVKSN